MQIVVKNIKDLTPYHNNPRNNQNAVQAVAKSIQEFGFLVPVVVDNKNTIVAGHTRVAAADMLGITDIPTLVASNLTPDQIRAFRLADNKVAELSEWDDEKLMSELQELQNIGCLEISGFSQQEFTDLLNSLDTLERHDTQNHSGASPWERMANEPAEGVLFTFGDITCKIPDVIYEQFKDCIGDDITRVTEVLVNGVCST